MVVSFGFSYTGIAFVFLSDPMVILCTQKVLPGRVTRVPKNCAPCLSGCDVQLPSKDKERSAIVIEFFILMRRAPLWRYEGKVLALAYYTVTIDLNSIFLFIAQLLILYLKL